MKVCRPEKFLRPVIAQRIVENQKGQKLAGRSFMSVRKEAFGMMPDGREISLYTIENENGVSASFTDLGAIWVRMMVPDRAGKLCDVLLGYDDGDGYLVNGPHMGSVVGRIANRTGGAKFRIGEKEYCLEKNNGENNLHSGPDYFDKRLWAAKESGEDSIVFFLESPDGDQGFPGNARISVKYTLNRENTVEITYLADCDQDTPMNLTNHAYFNLGGQDSGSILNHKAQINAEMFTPSAADSVPTGEILLVEGTPMDFRKPKTIGEEIDSDFVQLVQAKGYDHNWCLSHVPGVYSFAASVYDPESGRAMDVYTDLPGVQFYTANWLNSEKGKGKAVYESRNAYCFETQMYPDAVNKPQFASPVIKAGSAYVTRTGYHFYCTGK